MQRVRRGAINVGAAVSVALTLAACTTVGDVAQHSRGVINVAATAHTILRPGASATESAAVAAAQAAVNAAADHQDAADMMRER